MNRFLLSCITDLSTYNELVKLFSPGYAIPGTDHPFLKNLSHPFFQKVLTYTDQVIFILNHSTFEFLFISENAINVLGFRADDYKQRGLAFSFERIHPADSTALINVVFPEYYRHFDTLSPEDKLKMKLSYTCRFKKANGQYIQFLQQNIPLTIENGKVILGLMVAMDISAYKKNDQVIYKNVLIRGVDDSHVLSQGVCEKKSDLTDREVTILSMTAIGLSEKQISDRLSVSLHTVKSHRKNMIRKAGVKNAAELVKYGLANLLI